MKNVLRWAGRQKESLVFCDLPFTQIKVTSEGDVNMCCWQGRRTLGNLREQGLDGVWFGETAESIRAETLAGRLHSRCARGFCPHQYQPLVADKSALHPPYPAELELDLPNTHCNIGGPRPSETTPACIMCRRSALRFLPQEDHLDDVCRLLRPLMPHLHSIHVQGIAEPFWKDRLFDVTDLLGFAAHKTRVLLSTITNGTVLPEDRLERWLCDFPRSRLLFSIDAATPETYRRIRRIDAFDLVTRTVRNAARNRRPGQTVEILHTINTMNVHECVAMVDFAAEAGVDGMEFNPTDPVDESMTSFTVHVGNAPIFRKAQQDVIGRARATGVRVRFLRNLDLNLA